MANKQLINGKVYDWSSVTITASGMENMEPMEISYDDEQESEPIYGRGGKIRGYGTGNQKNSVKLSLLREDFNEMCRVIQSKGYKNFYKYVIPKIVVNYADEGAATCTDVLTNIVLSKRSFKAAQGDKSMKVDLDGIAMGGIGSDAAIEAADVVLMDDRPEKLALVVRIARRTRRIVTENIVFALGVKAAVLALGAAGLAGMWLAVFADVGVCVLAVLNAMRMLRRPAR